MGKKQTKAVRCGQTPGVHQAVTLREENAGKMNVYVSSILKLQHLQKLAKWAGGEAGIPQLGALFGRHLAANAEAAGIPLDSSCFLCQRCETILQPGFNCTIRIDKNVKEGRWRKKSCSGSQNNVSYTCSFCSHRNLMRGTPGGHVRGLLTSSPRLDLDIKLHCRRDINLSTTNAGAAAIDAFPQQTGETFSSGVRGNSEVHVKGLLASKPRLGLDTELHCRNDINLSTTNAGVAAIEAIPRQTGEIFSSGVRGDSELKISSDRETPIRRTLLIPKKRKRANGSVSCNQLSIGEDSTTATDSGKGIDGSIKRKRKGWSSLKEIAEEAELKKTRFFSNLAIPFLM